VTLVHWDEVPWEAVDRGRLRWERQRLVPNLSRYRIAPGAQLFPAHVHVDEDEHVVVLAGSGLSWQDGATVELRGGDHVHHPPDGAAHTLLAGDDGMEVLIFGSGSATGLTRLPRAGVVRVGNGLWPLDVTDPLAAEPPLDAPPPTGRARAMLAVEPDVDEHGTRYAWSDRSLGGTLAGLHYTVLPPGREDAPLHWHTAEDERFVVLAGEGFALLDEEAHPIRAGSVLHCPPGRGPAHAMRAADDSELTYLVHGTRVPHDLVLYPRSRKVLIGRGQWMRYEPTDNPWEGEE